MKLSGWVLSGWLAVTRHVLPYPLLLPSSSFSQQLHLISPKRLINKKQASSRCLTFTHLWLHHKWESQEFIHLLHIFFSFFNTLALNDAACFVLTCWVRMHKWTALGSEIQTKPKKKTTFEEILSIPIGFINWAQASGLWDKRDSPFVLPRCNYLASRVLPYGILSSDKNPLSQKACVTDTSRLWKASC